MAIKIISKATSPSGSVQKKGVLENSGQGCCEVVYQIPLLSQFHTTRGTVLSATRSLEASLRARCRRRQLYHQRKPDCGKSQVTKTDTPSCRAGYHKDSCSVCVYPEDNQDQERDFSAKTDSTYPEPARNRYRKPIKTVEPLRIEDLEEKLECLALSTENKSLGTVSPDFEEAYMRGEPLTPPEIEFAEQSDLEDDYWTWDQDTQQFTHWDEDSGERVCFPERFD
ncbi:uncharacterized protein B0J16DRAFT_391745 [Fusarium flagelliforme]|uniref:uncharacterized protein n=1 Tax=Fusarium flagelliforme TaxID=2675880 RepID=UPI001E8E1E2D|nr:uncharacterized protein B0J16DRAFT_391745 [Fusarium flagelliforme]KAH7198020.1 hypothetical protein B0J16DRAFT_391745 [Fusarium flagelliforme]